MKASTATTTTTTTIIIIVVVVIVKFLVRLITRQWVHDNVNVVL